MSRSFKIQPIQDLIQRDDNEEQMLNTDDNEEQEFIKQRPDFQQPQEKLNNYEKELKIWRKKLEQTEEDDNDMESENLYNGMIFIRRFCRLFLQFCFIGLAVGFFLWGYFTTVKDYYWNANEIVDNIIIHTGNCFLNINDSEDYLQFKVYGKGRLEQQIYPSKEFLIKGEMIDKGKANVQIKNLYSDVRSCMVDLMLPKNMSNINILCSSDSECIIVFAQQELYVQNTFNATCEKSARMQMNIRNIQTNKFSFTSDSPGTLFLNHILTKEGYIAMANGELVIQSTKSFQLVYTSQSHAVCARGFQLTDQIQEDCYISAAQNATVIQKICKGQISICEKSSCDVQQQIQVIGNQASIYANILYNIGKPLVVESDEVQIFSTQVFKQQIDFDQDSLSKIQQFMNTSGSADVAVRIDVVGSYLLQHSYTTYWSFFSNPSYASFQPWWLSVFSAGFLNPTFSQLTVSLKPGICPWNPILNSKQKMQIRNLIKQSFNTTYGEAIYIDVDDSLRIDDKLKENEHYFGLSHLQQKQKGKFENWIILDDLKNTIVYKQLEYDDNFIASIILSLISSLIFSIVCIYFLKEILKKLENNVLKSCSEFQHYSAATTGSAPNNTTDIVKDIMAKLKQQPNKREPPLVMSIFTYNFYLFSQNQFKSSPRLFIDSLFRLSNQEETDLYYANELDDKYLSMDQEEIKEKYEQFCNLNKMTIGSLAQYENYFNSYGFELAEKQNVQLLTKIKLNPQAKPYQQLSLSLEQKQSMSSIEIFFQTQCLLTGIEMDTLNSDFLYQAYLKFCGNHIKVEQFNIQEISKNYNFQISVKKIIQLTRIPFLVGDQVYSTPQGFLSRIVQSLRNIKQQENSEKAPVYIFKRQENEMIQFQLNPLKQIKKDKLTKDFNKLSLIWNSIYYIFSAFSQLYFDNDVNQLLSKYFNYLYMKGWFITDLIIVLGNNIIGVMSTLPLLYIIIIINTSYSPYSIYNPETLLFVDDILFRPWIIFDYFRYFDDWAYVLFIVLILYTILAVLIQTQQYYWTQFPDEINYMMEQKRLKKGTAIFTYLQWIIFLFLAFSLFFYFGLIIVWLLLGSIINPNFYLVYSSSALSLVAFIAAQLNQIHETYEMTCKQINKIIKEILFDTFPQLIRPIIKEQEKLQDTSIFIVTSKSMREAKKFAQSLGIEDKLEELCNVTNQLVEPLDLVQYQLKLQQIKETFIQTSSEIFLEKMRRLFKIPESLAKLLSKFYFVSFDEFVQALLQELEQKTEIHYPILKWFYSTSIQFQDLSSQVNSQNGSNHQKQFFKQINQQLIELYVQIVIGKMEIKEQDKEIKEQDMKIIYTLQSLLINQSECNILSQFKKIYEILKKPIKNIQFKFQKYTLEVFMTLHNLEKQKCRNLEQIKTDYSFEFFTRFNTDQEINFFYQFLFNNQQYLTVPPDYQDDYSCSEFLSKIFEKHQKPPNQQQQNQFRFIVNYLRNDFSLQSDNEESSDEQSNLSSDYYSEQNSDEQNDSQNDFLRSELIIPNREEQNSVNQPSRDEQNSVNQPSRKEQISVNQSNRDEQNSVSQSSGNEPISVDQSNRDKQKDSYSKSFLEVGITYISLCTKDWKEELQINLEGCDKDLFYDILYVGSKFLWSSKYFDGNSTFNQIDKREKMLTNRNLIKLISQALNISENAVIGLILILKNEISIQSNYLEQAYIEIVKKSNKSDQSNARKFEEQTKIIKFLIELLSKTNFEDIFPFLQENQDLQIYNDLNSEFIDLVFKSSNIVIFQLFNGCIIYEYFQNESKKDYFDFFDFKSKKFKKKIEIDVYKQKFKEFGYFFDVQEAGKYNPQNQKESDPIQNLNKYHSHQFTFYTFLQKYKDGTKILDLIKKELKTLDLSEFLFQILKKQGYILRQKDQDFNEHNNVFHKSIQYLGQILFFFDLQKMQKAIKFFIEQNQSKENNFQMEKIFQHISKVSQIEKTVSNATTYLLKKIPYPQIKLVKLKSLFIDQIFQTTQGLDTSLYKDILHIFKYEQPEFIVNEWSESILNEQILINKRSTFKINENARKHLKNFILFAEPIINLLFSEQKNIRDQAIIEILLNFNRINNKRVLKRLQSIIIEIVDKDYKVLFQLPKDYASQIFQSKTEKSIVDQALLLIQGFIETEAIFSKKKSYKQQTIFTIIGDYLKYYLTSDLKVFIELVLIHCNKIVRKEKQNQKAIKALFSLMSQQFDYEELNSIYNLNKSELRLSNFLSKCMFTNQKSKLLEEDIEIKQILKQKFQIQDFQTLVDIANILDYNSVNPDSLIQKFKLKNNNEMFFKWVFAFKMQIRNGESWENFQDQYNQLVQQRKQLVELHDVGIDMDISTLEVMNYFSYPRPLNFIFLLDQIKIFEQFDSISLFFSGILGIVKYDKYSKYRRKSIDCILYRSNHIESLSQKSIKESLFYIAQKSDQDLQEAFQFLQLSIGLDQIFINAIFQKNLKDNNPFVDYIQKVLLEGKKSQIEKVDKAIEILSSLDNDTMLKVIEYETLQNAQVCKESSLLNGKKNLMISLNIKEEKFDDIRELLSQIARGKFSQKFPLSSIVFINVLKQIRLQIRQKIESKLKELLQIIVIVYERYLYFNDQNQFFNFNIEDTIKLLYLGLFEILDLEKSKCRDVDDLLQYPSLRNVFKNQHSNQSPPQQFQEQIDDYYRVYCSYSQKQNKPVLEQFQKDLVQDFEKKNENYIQDKQKLNLAAKNLQTYETLQSLIRNLQNLDFCFYISSLLEQLNEKGDEYSVIEIIQQLMSYYAGDFTFSNKQKVYIDENLIISFKQLVVNLINQFERSDEQLNFLIELIYNPKGLNDDNIYKIWEEGKNSIFISIITIQVRLSLEKFRNEGEFKDQAQFIPNSYLYLSIGDDYTIKKEENKYVFDDYNAKFRIQRNNIKLSAALRFLVDNCLNIQDCLKFPLKILFRCFLGDVEAWYTLINSILEMEEKKYQLELQPFFRDFILRLLISLKNQRNTSITQEQIKSTSLYELFKQHTKYDLFQLIKTSLMDMIYEKLQKKDQNNKDEQIKSLKDFCFNIFKFFDCIVQQNFKDLLDPKKLQFQMFFCSMVFHQVYFFIPESPTNVFYTLNLLISSLVKKPLDIEGYKNNIKVFQKEQTEGAWIFIKGMILTDYSKDINVAIDHLYQFFETLQMEEFYHYPQLLTTISLYNYYQDQDQITKREDVLSYPLSWIKKVNNQNDGLQVLYVQEKKKKIEEFKSIQKELIKTKNKNQNMPFKKGISTDLIKLLFTIEKLISNNELVNLNNNLLDFQSNLQNQNLDLLEIIQLRLIQKVFNKNDQGHFLQMLFIQKLIDLEKANNSQENNSINNHKSISFTLQKSDVQAKSQENNEKIQLQDIEQVIQNLFKMPETNELKKQKNQEILAELYEFYQSNKVESLNQIVEYIINYQQKEKKNLQEQDPIKQLLDLAQELWDQQSNVENESEQFSEEQLKTKIILILEKFFEKAIAQEKLQQLQACIKTIISIKNKRFPEISTEFYQLFQIDEFNRTNITNFLQDFLNLTQIFTNLINEKLNSMVNLDLFSYYKNVSNAQKKIEETIDLSYHDLFKILDKQGRRVVKPEDLLQFLKRLHIDITHHKLREMLVKIKEEVINMETCLIDFYEFKEIMQQLNKYSLLLSLTYLGISKQQLFVALLVTVIYLGLVLTFILIGVQALAIPGTFAAIINAILPMIGGFGLNKQAKNKQIRAVNQNTIMESVKKAIKIISEKSI